MIKKFLLFYVLFFSITISCQNLNCKDVHIGKFEINSKLSGKTEILRTKECQIETNDFMNVKIEYDIVWIDECNYELRNRQLLSGTSKYNGLPTDVIKVQILDIRGNKIFIKTGANFSDQFFEGVIDIVK